MHFLYVNTCIRDKSVKSVLYPVDTETIRAPIAYTIIPFGNKKALQPAILRIKDNCQVEFYTALPALKSESRDIIWSPNLQILITKL